MRLIAIAFVTLGPVSVLVGCSDEHEGHSVANQVAQESSSAQEHEHAGHVPSGYVPVDVSPERVQMFGIRTEDAVREALVREVRTVGIVRTDETLESHVHVKWSGWIEEFFVSFVGQEVAAGDPLFSVYSPEIVTAQEELLIAVGRFATAQQAGREAEVETARALLESARTKLRLWDVPDEAIQGIEEQRKILRTVTVKAPRDGTVLEKMALPGMYVEPTMDLYTIADLSRVWVLADLYEYEIPFVELGQQAGFTPVGTLPVPDPIVAKAAFIYPTVDPTTRTVKVRFEVPNEDGRLRPGAFGTVRLSVPVDESIVVPADAILPAGDRNIAFVRVGEGRFQPRAVRLGVRAGDRVQVLEGISEGEGVVTRAQFLLDSESRLRAASASGGHVGHGGH